MRQERSHAQSVGRDTVPVGGMMEGSGFLKSPESLQSQLGWFKEERGALSFHPGQEEKRDSFIPQVLLSLLLILCSFAIVQSLLLTPSL